MKSAEKICGYLEKKAKQTKDVVTFFIHPSQSSPASSGRDNQTEEGTKMKNEDCSSCDQFEALALKNEMDTLKKERDTLTGQNKELSTKVADSDKKLKEATDALNGYKEAEKKALVDSIVAKTEFKADDLGKKPVEELRVIYDAIEKVKKAGSDATVKNVRSAGDNAPPTRLNVSTDGRIDPTKSLMGHPKKGADGLIVRDATGNAIWEL